MVRVQDNEGQLKITIPKDIARLMKWKKGIELVFIQDSSGNLLLRELKREKGGSHQ